MINNPEQEGLTRKEIVKATHCPPYLIAYYSACGYLPVLRPSTGPGVPVIFHQSAVEVVKERMAHKQAITADELDDH